MQWNHLIRGHCAGQNIGAGRFSSARGIICFALEIFGERLRTGAFSQRYTQRDDQNATPVEGRSTTAVPATNILQSNSHQTRTYLADGTTLANRYGNTPRFSTKARDLLPSCVDPQCPNRTGEN